MKANPIGLAHGIIRLNPYTPAWAECFLLEAARLREGLGQCIGRIEHTGSTAVPGLAAKPIIDLMASVSCLEEALSLIPDLEGLGYAHGETDEIVDRHYFALRLPNGASTHHLSLAEPESQFWTCQILFRDYLRAHPESRQEYADLKQRLAVQHVGDRPGYVEAKTEFVARVLDLTRQAEEPLASN